MYKYRLTRRPSVIHQFVSILSCFASPLQLGQSLSEVAFKFISMTSLLTHTVAHSTTLSFRPKTNNQPIKKFLSLEVSWVKVVKNGEMLTFKVNFLCQKLSESFQSFFFIEEFDFRGTPFVIDIFWKLQFLNHFIF